MDNTEKEQRKETARDEFHKNTHSNDYEFLVQRLKSIRESISLLEKNLFNKET